MDTIHLSLLDKDRLRGAAELLLKARRETAPIENLPEDLRPHTLDEAYYLQDVLVEALGAVGGWKVGAASLEATPLCAPMLLMGFAKDGQMISENFRRLRGIEAEIAFLLGKDLPVRKEPYSREEVIEAIASAHPAIELLESAFVDPDAVGRFSSIGDLQTNGGFVAGPAFSGWKQADLTKESVTVVMDGVVRNTGTASNTAGTDLVRLITWLANEAQVRTGGLKAGDWITTGSWGGKLLANPGSEVLVEFSTFGKVRIYFS